MRIGPKKTKSDLRLNVTHDCVCVTGTLTENNILNTPVTIREDTVRKISSIIGWMQHNRNHPNNQLTYKEYIDMREAKEKQKENKND